MVGGGVGGGSVGVTDVAVVGGFVVGVVGGTVVSGGGGSVVGVVVCTGGEVVPGVGGEVVPVFRGAVVPGDSWVVAVVPPGPGAAVVVVDSTVDDVDVDEELDVDVGATVVVGRAVVDDDWLATCRLGEVSSPVVTSTNSAAMATVARAYSPTLKR